MKARVIEDADDVTYVVVCDPGDEAFDELTRFARAQDLEAAQITAVGSFSRATVGWFDRETKQYRRIPVDEQCEVLSLIGDVAEGQDGPSVHVHVVLGLSDGTTRGGHLLEGRVFPTLEVIVREAPAELRKVMNPESGSRSSISTGPSRDQGTQEHEGRRASWARTKPRHRITRPPPWGIRICPRKAWRPPPGIRPARR